MLHGLVAPSLALAIGLATPREPAISIPLRFQGRVVGAIAIWEFLQQKTELAEVDYDIFNLLGAHAASALEAARLVTVTGEAPRLQFSAFEGLL